MEDNYYELIKKDYFEIESDKDLMQTNIISEEDINIKDVKKIKDVKLILNSLLEQGFEHISFKKGKLNAYKFNKMSKDKIENFNKNKF